MQIFYRVTKINAPRADWPQLFSRCENFEFLRLVLKTKVSEDVASKLTMRRGQKGFISLTRIDSWHFLINNVKWGLGGGKVGHGTTSEAHYSENLDNKKFLSKLIYKKSFNDLNVNNVFHYW